METSGAVVTRAGIGLTGVGGSTIAAREAAAALTGQPLTAESIGQAADLAAAAARPRTDHRGSAEYKRHMVRTFVVRILSRGVPRRRGQPDMTVVYEDHGDEADAQAAACRSAGSSSPSTARRRSPRSSPGCCWPT